MATRHFSFFGKHLSRVAGEKCCEFGQNGLPLSKEFVSDFLKNANSDVQFWKPDEDFKVLRHSWFFTDYLQAAAFLLEVAKTDSMNVLKQMPNVMILRKEIIRVELTTPKLGGLTKADLALACQISLLPSKDYRLVAISDEGNFRRELRLKRLEKIS